MARLLKIAALLVVLGAVWILAASLLVERAARGRTEIKCRELIARANMLVDLFVLRREPKFLGEKVRLPA